MRTIITLLVTAGMAFAQPNDAQRLERLRLYMADLQSQLDTLKVKYTDSAPAVVELKGKLELLRKEEEALRERSLPLDFWWRKTDSVRALGLSSDQQGKVDEVFQQYRLKLVDLNASLEKEEIALEPLISANPLNESKATAQIDRVAQARADLEKARGRMLLGMRKVLTAEQWQKLNGLSK